MDSFSPQIPSQIYCLNIFHLFLPFSSISQSSTHLFSIGFYYLHHLSPGWLQYAPLVSVPSLVSLQIFFPTPARGLCLKYKFDHVTPLPEMFQWPPGAPQNNLNSFLTRLTGLTWSSWPRCSQSPVIFHDMATPNCLLSLLPVCCVLFGLRTFVHAVPSTQLIFYLTILHVCFHLLTVISSRKCQVHPPNPTVAQLHPGTSMVRSFHSIL